MDEAVRRAQRAERDVEACRGLQTADPGEQSNLVRLLGQQLQDAYTHLWKLQVQAGLADLKARHQCSLTLVRTKVMRTRLYALSYIACRHVGILAQRQSAGDSPARWWGGCRRGRSYAAARARSSGSAYLNLSQPGRCSGFEHLFRDCARLYWRSRGTQVWLWYAPASSEPLPAPAISLAGPGSDRWGLAGRRFAAPWRANGSVPGAAVLLASCGGRPAAGPAAFAATLHAHAPTRQRSILACRVRRYRLHYPALSFPCFLHLAQLLHILRPPGLHVCCCIGRKLTPLLCSSAFSSC